MVTPSTLIGIATIRHCVEWAHILSDSGRAPQAMKYRKFEICVQFNQRRVFGLMQSQLSCRHGKKYYMRNTSLLETSQLNPFHVLSSSLHKNNFNIILGLPCGVYTLGFSDQLSKRTVWDSALRLQALVKCVEGLAETSSLMAAARMKVVAQ